MKAPETPENEFDRIKDLYSYNILDTLGDIDFDYITKMAAQICQTKISVVSLIDRDRQWFKSKYGLDAPETPREVSFCGHAILDPFNLLEVKDARKDERFHDNPLVTGAPHVIFYAGIPLMSEKGNALGTLCVIDDHPGELSDDQKESLKILSHQVVRLLDLRKRTLEIEESNKELTKYSKHLKEFIQISTEDMNGPVLSMDSIINIAILKQPDPQIEGYLKRISREIDILKEMMEDFRRYDEIVKYEIHYDNYSIQDLSEELKSILMGYMRQYPIEVTSELECLRIDKKSLIEIFYQLFTYLLGYGEYLDMQFNLQVQESYFNYNFSLRIKELVIAEQHIKNIFDPFVSKIIEQKNQNKYKKDLSILQKQISLLGGKIKVVSNSDIGTEVHFSIEK
ncbi:sensor histidine kinase [Flammeovirga pacifica]|uniref:GAF domain-containing protein n=1 Tax=Flammeovirga pacifica TaxID=915059 RepID=A0A1S1YTI3_FLAPC|nr:GAF domain-containing protein [Flammeovirga pacifica]OHX64329.1 hypothetical protein NH26_22305 [Flammeovirga pacifica]